jgi:hypothetical protein
MPVMQSAKKRTIRDLFVDLSQSVLGWQFDWTLYTIGLDEGYIGLIFLCESG